jgi:putative aminopeptidase FrvX
MINKDKLKEVLSIQTHSFEQWRMFAYIVRECKAKNYDLFTLDGNIYVTKGNADKYPCIVAHMDSVHKIGEDLYPLEVGDKITGFNRVTMTQTGIGGDDKVGVYIALECLNKFDNVKAVFFRDEEVGCVGSNLAYLDFFGDCTYILQCDRRGRKDFITNASGTELCSKKFKEDILPILSSWGYSFANGMMTDVMTLKDNGLKISCANISCGYYNPHMDNEYIIVNHVEICMALVFDIFTNLTDTYKHTPAPTKISSAHYFSTKYPSKNVVSKYSGWGSRGAWDSYEDFYTPSKKDKKQCADCWIDADNLKEGYCELCYKWHAGIK